MFLGCFLDLGKKFTGISHRYISCFHMSLCFHQHWRLFFLPEPCPHTSKMITKVVTAIIRIMKPTKIWMRERFFHVSQPLQIDSENKMQWPEEFQSFRLWELARRPWPKQGWNWMRAGNARAQWFNDIWEEQHEQNPFRFWKQNCAKHPF